MEYDSEEVLSIIAFKINVYANEKHNFAFVSV